MDSRDLTNSITASINTLNQLEQYESEGFQGVHLTPYVNTFEKCVAGYNGLNEGPEKEKIKELLDKFANGLLNICEGKIDYEPKGGFVSKTTRKVKDFATSSLNTAKYGQRVVGHWLSSETAETGLSPEVSHASSVRDPAEIFLKKFENFTDDELMENKALLEEAMDKIALSIKPGEEVDVETQSILQRLDALGERVDEIGSRQSSDVPSVQQSFSPDQSQRAKAEALQRVETELEGIPNGNMRREVNEMLKNFISPLPFTGEAAINNTESGFTITIPCEQAIKGSFRTSSKIIYDPILVPENGNVTLTVRKEGDEVFLTCNNHVQIQPLEGERLEGIINQTIDGLRNNPVIGSFITDEEQANIREKMTSAARFGTSFEEFRFKVEKSRVWGDTVYVKAKIKEIEDIAQQAERESQIEELESKTPGALRLKYSTNRDLILSFCESQANLSVLSLYEYGGDDKKWAKAEVINRLLRQEKDSNDKTARVTGWKPITEGSKE